MTSCIPSLGAATNDILDAFKQLDREYVGRKITEAAIIGSNLYFRWQGSGRLGVVVGEIGIRDASTAEYGELEDAIELGQVQIYRKPLYCSGNIAFDRKESEVLHQATGRPLDPNSLAVRRQRERFARAFSTQ